MSITSSGRVIMGGDYHQTGTTQYHELGTMMELSDGRIFRYAQSDATGFAAGLVLVAATPTTGNHANANVAAAVIGATTVAITLGATAAAENLYAGGYFWVNDGTGEGHVYTISGHPASAGSAALNVTLREPLAIALVASGTSQCSLIQNPYKGVVIAGATPATKLVGVSSVAVAANGFGWVQTKGLASVLEGGTDPVVGDVVISAASGACGIATFAITDHTIGICHVAQSASGDQTLVWLSLD